MESDKTGLYPHETSAKTGHGSHKCFRMLSVFSHVVGILILFLLPEMIITFYSPEVNHIPPGIYLKAVIYAGVFYANFYFIIDRTLVPKPRFTRFTLYNIALIALALLALYLVWSLIDPAGKEVPREFMPGSGHRPPEGMNPAGPNPPPGPPHHDNAVVILSRDFIIIVLTIALSVAIRLNYKWVKMDQKRRELEILSKDMELAQLRSQLNPHFLFNTLNSISALIDIDSEKAKEAIHRISKMLRYSLYNGKQCVTLRQECDFLSDYVEMMKLRLPDDFRLDVEIDCSRAPEMPMQPLLFINIVENAFKYGMRAMDPRQITVRITTDGERVTCLCANNYTPSGKAPGPEPRSTGLGLDNLRRRVELRYPGCHSLDISDDGHRFTVTLTISPSRPGEDQTEQNP